MFLLLYPLISNECFMEASINAWLAIVVGWQSIIMYTVLLRVQLGPTINLTLRSLYCNAYLFFTSCMLIIPWYFFEALKNSSSSYDIMNQYTHCSLCNIYRFRVTTRFWYFRYGYTGFFMMEMWYYQFQYIYLPYLYDTLLF